MVVREDRLRNSSQVLAATNSEPPFPAAPQVSSHSCTGSADGGSTVSSGGSAVSYLHRAGTVPSTRPPTATSTPPAEGAAPAAPVRPTPQLAQTVRLCAGTPTPRSLASRRPGLVPPRRSNPVEQAPLSVSRRPLLSSLGRGRPGPETSRDAGVGFCARRCPLPAKRAKPSRTPDHRRDREPLYSFVKLPSAPA